MADTKNITSEGVSARERYRETFETEYRIIQDKLDKIGEFKFKIRGWSITIQSALFVAIFTQKLSSTLPPIFLLLFIPLIFHCLEQQQEHIGKALTDRALELEKAIDRLTFERHESARKKINLDSNIINRVYGAPRIGVSIRHRKRKFFSNMIIFKENFLYHFQYVLFAFVLILFIFNPQFFGKGNQDKQAIHIHLHQDVADKDKGSSQDKLLFQHFHGEEK
jgi:hypothetical protein